ncbi:MAG: hydroxylamine reductase [Negativicutes bacterium]
MFCYQCEQTMKGQGCNLAQGVCGKSAVVSDQQDLLLYATQAVAMYAHALRGMGKTYPDADKFVVEALFTTITNVNFDENRIDLLLQKANDIRNFLRSEWAAAGGATLANGAAAWKYDANRSVQMAQAADVGIKARELMWGEEAAGVYYLIVFGLKGMAAYADHALVLGQKDDSVFAFFHEALDFLAQEQFDLNALVAMALRTGAVNIRVMELLDAGNTGTYGHPVPTSVPVTTKAGKAIVVSGHDLRDLQLLLEQTAGKGINIYTHGEMLPTHAYPELKKHPHFYGNYGSAWQNQQNEFDAFPGAILMTTNCIQKPRPSYNDRIFTTGLVAFPGVKHIGADKDFSPVIAAALAAPGFVEDEPKKEILVGFGRNAVLGAAEKVIDLVQRGKIRHFFLVGGCDGAKPGRNYYTELAQSIPQDCVILTLACGKYRFNKLEFGDIEGLPRLLDIGQCNDAYSAVKIAMALADAFKTEVNGLPLSMILSWYEQKAVVILLSLLNLGIKNIKLGPSLPAFIKPAVLNVLVEKFGIAPTTTVEADLKEILG